MAHYFWLSALIPGSEGWLEERGSETRTSLDDMEAPHKSQAPTHAMEIDAGRLLFSEQHGSGCFASSGRACDPPEMYTSMTTYDRRRLLLPLRLRSGDGTEMHDQMLSWHPAIPGWRRTASKGRSLGEV